MTALEHVYWIGGGSGAGKTTVARRLAADLGFQYVSTDETMQDHARRATPQDCPLLHAFMKMDMDERWVTRSPQIMLDTFHWFHGEAFEMIVQDLRALPADRAIIVEGFRLLPHLVAPLAAQGRALWLLPTPAFRRAAFDGRGLAGSFISRTSDPSRALENLLARDALFTERLRTETNELGLASIAVSKHLTEAALIDAARDALGV